MGAANKVSGKKITGIRKSLRKYIRRKKTGKKVLSLMKMRSSLRRFHKKDFFPMHLQFEYRQGCF